MTGSIRQSNFAPKAQHNPAQGTALGTGWMGHSALKGRHISGRVQLIEFCRPYRALGFLRINSQGDALGWYVSAFQALETKLR